MHLRPAELKPLLLNLAYKGVRSIDLHYQKGEHHAGESNTDTPMARIRRQSDKIIREDIWPEETDYGTPVIVAGGEVGILQKWWNAPDQQEWRWSLEFYNHR